MKPFPACYRARYRAANCHRGFPSFLNGGGERRVGKGFSHERTNSRFIHSRWTVSWKDNRARTRVASLPRLLVCRSRAANCVRQSPTFLPSSFSFSASFPRGNARLQGLTRPGLGSAASLSNGTSTSWLDDSTSTRVCIPSSRRLSSHLPEITRKLHPVSKPDSQTRKDLRIARESFCPSPFLTQFRAVFSRSRAIYLRTKLSGFLSSLFSSNDNKIVELL